MDIALQHISDNMLQRMRRHVTKKETYRLIEQFRKEVPGIHLRTTLMVGHPGETEEDFEELKEFVRKVRFDRMGAFTYSEEEGTYAAANYEDSIQSLVLDKSYQSLNYPLHALLRLQDLLPENQTLYAQCNIHLLYDQ